MTASGENMKRPFMTDEIKSVLNKPPTNKSPRPDDFTGEFHQTFKEELTSIILKLFQKIEEEGIL